MISINELMSTAKRLELIIQNSSNEIDSFVAYQARENILAVAKQLDGIKDTPQFKEAAKQFFENINEKD